MGLTSGSVTLFLSEEKNLLVAQSRLDLLVVCSVDLTFGQFLFLCLKYIQRRSLNSIQHFLISVC